ncbi:uncharacterized protein LOC118192775 [Stegodyphus dumicola]|uniref:uncharacterized protein LOC118192775 n=1 Tax=Stegodyphus dumicola TaxID=202533 RepID=UPI0015B05264|nr:uncharacterized protein LOC118192775 [Stegodyphus dumicola]XP_035219683.1 uncharacterized protein LOC118192775 [Stegodyphus dumicola]
MGRLLSVLICLVILFTSILAHPPWVRRWSYSSRYPSSWRPRNWQAYPKPWSHHGDSYDHSDHHSDYPHHNDKHSHDSHDYYDHEDSHSGTSGCGYGRPCRDEKENGNNPQREDNNNPQSDTLGCSCLLYVEYTLVFQRRSTDRLYSCDESGLQKCSAYCNNLFQDEGLRASSRQDACDVLGREVHTSWYRKNQVCGSNGPYRDIRLSENLCCRGGQTSVAC